MQTIDDVWNKFATQDELAQAYIQQGALFDELDIIIEDFFAAYERFKEERKQKEGKNVQS